MILTTYTTGDKDGEVDNSNTEVCFVACLLSFLSCKIITEIADHLMSGKARQNNSNATKQNQVRTALYGSEVALENQLVKEFVSLACTVHCSG